MLRELNKSIFHRCLRIFIINLDLLEAGLIFDTNKLKFEYKNLFGACPQVNRGPFQTKNKQVNLNVRTRERARWPGPRGCPKGVFTSFR